MRSRPRVIRALETYEVGMRMRRFMLAIGLFAGWIGIHGVTPAKAESTMSCPAGTYDMLD
jgi:hypothetical protein